MKFYINQSTGTDALFTIIDSVGQSVYCVIGDTTSIGSKYYLVDKDKNQVARISKVGFPTISKYTITIDDNDKAHVTQNLASSHNMIKIKGKKWRFRGDLLTRSYDLIDTDSSVIMTHGRCWNENGDCFAVDILDESNVILCLCIAVILDSTLIGGSAKPLPVS